MLAKQLQGAAKGLTVDSDFENVTLLLHGNGTNGAQNNTFIDGSSNAFSITRNGNTTQGTFSPYGSNWSNYFDGTGDYIENTSNYLVASTTSTFTIEAWVFMTADPVDDANDIPAMISVNCGGGNNSVNYLAFGPISSRKLRIRWFDGTGKNAEGSTTLALNTWYHVACSVSSNAIKMFVNGVEETLSGTTTLTNRNGDANGFALGQTFTYANYTGYISNARVLSGTALYTTGFTPSTAPLTAITNTVLLTCQSNRFRDASSNAYAITTAGNTSVQRFSPFSPTAAYASGTIGGSGYFDGTGDSLEIADNTAFTLDGDFTIEGWLYPFSVADSDNFIGKWQPSNQEYLFWPESGVPKFYWAPNSAVTALLTSSVSIPTNAWTHLAVTRSGNSFTMWVNGVSRATATNSSAVTNTSSPVEIGRLSQYPPNYDYQGYMAGVRIVKGTAVYTTGFTPPTSPVTAITNTSLLCNFTNAGIIDNAMMNDLETVGNAQISTTQSKFGGSSMYFDGTGDWLVGNFASKDLYSFGTGNFTVEMWVYTSNLSNYQTLLDTRASDSQIAWCLFIDNTGKPYWYDASGVQLSSTAISSNTWTHLAIARSGSTLKMFLGGTEVFSGTNTNSQNPTGTFYVGRNAVNAFLYTGYIDDLRITKGVARYTANFTAPTAPFADQ